MTKITEQALSTYLEKNELNRIEFLWSGNEFGLGGSVRHAQAQCAASCGCAAAEENCTVANHPMRRAACVRRTPTQCAAQTCKHSLGFRNVNSPSPHSNRIQSIFLDANECFKTNENVL